MVVRETAVACSCPGREDNALVKRLLGVVDEVFDLNIFMVFSDNVGELRLSFQQGEA